jgi:hypothetical protein
VQALRRLREFPGKKPCADDWFHPALA